MPGCNDDFFIPHTTSYIKYHGEYQRAINSIEMEASGDENMDMESEHSEDLLVVKELKKEKYYPGHGRYFLRKRELKKQQKKQKKFKK